MKRIIALAVPLGVVAVAVGAFVMLETRRGPDWRMALDDYVAQSAQQSEVITMQSVAEASKPWEFNEAMGRAVRNNWRWGIAKLPYPPQAVKCVLLERIRVSTAQLEKEPSQQVVFVGYHTDGLYRTGWVVHEGSEEPFPQELKEDLATIGCHVSLE